MNAGELRCVRLPDVRRDKEYDGSVIVRIDNDGGTRVAGMPIGIRTKQSPLLEA